MQIERAENLLQWLLSEEDCENDDRRFYCSYLIAHTSLAMSDSVSDSNFFSTMAQSLLETLDKDKLSDQDKTGINSLWLEACDL
ncbi:hypothetical protein A9R01_06905 ['Osedax' symbiont bacterium Rs2_46_30_T18]|nr:hypothetical protein A9R01_06905 ['Osedax' symbiont bacterium Rs2_46_30_T18]